MAWNEPGNRNDSPWGKRPDNSSESGVDAALKNFQKRIESMLGGGGGEAGGEGRGGLGWLILALLALLWLGSGFFQINESDRGVIQRFGKFTEVRGPGWGYKLPWPIETVTKLNCLAR